MGKLGVLNFLTLNGFYKGPGGDISWHKHGSEEGEFSEDSVKAMQGSLLFGRVTYEMMAGYWPTPMAKEASPLVAEGMNKADKIVFSRTLDKAAWQNSRIIHGNLVEEVRKIKHERDLTILGSGSIVSQLAEADLIDHYQIMIDPVAIADGKSIFSGIRHQIDLKLVSTQSFKSGVVLLQYEPV